MLKELLSFPFMGSYHFLYIIGYLTISSIHENQFRHYFLCVRPPTLIVILILIVKVPIIIEPTENLAQAEDLSIKISLDASESFTHLNARLVGLLCRWSWQWISRASSRKLAFGFRKQGPSDQRIQHHGYQQGNEVKEHDIGEKHDQIFRWVPP